MIEKSELLNELFNNRINTNFKKRDVVDDKFIDGYYKSNRYISDNHKYVNFHDYGKFNYICIDYDNNDINKLFDLACFPEPNLIIKSNTTGNHHLVYILEYPVYSFGKDKPLSLFNDVKKQMNKLLSGDPSYNNRYIYNPYNSKDYMTFVCHTNRYMLGDFMMYFDIESNVNLSTEYRYHDDFQEYPVFPVGMRNTLMFDAMRKFAYSNYISSIREDFSLSEKTIEYGISLNQDICENPLSINEIYSISKSINYFVHKRFSESQYKDWISVNYAPEKQSYRGQLKNKDTRINAIIHIMNNLKSGEKITAKSVICDFNISSKTAYNWINKSKKYMTAIDQNDLIESVEFKEINEYFMKEEEMKLLPIETCNECKHSIDGFKGKYCGNDNQKRFITVDEIPSFCNLNTLVENDDIITTMKILDERDGYKHDTQSIHDRLIRYRSIETKDQHMKIVKIPDVDLSYFPSGIEYISYLDESYKNDHVFNKLSIKQANL